MPEIQQALVILLRCEMRRRRQTGSSCLGLRAFGSMDNQRAQDESKHFGNRSRQSIPHANAKPQIFR
jgi:hypothetical protein